MGRPNRSNTKNPNPALNHHLLPPPVWASLLTTILPQPHHHPRNHFPCGDTTTLYASRQGTSYTITKHPSNHVDLAKPAEIPPAKPTPNPTPVTYQPLVEKATPVSIPKSTHLATDHNTTKPSRTTPDEETSPTVIHGSF